MKKLYVVVLVGAAALALSVEACTAIVVGKKASATGRVLVAHNEDFDKAFMRHAMLPRRGDVPAMFWSEVKRHKGGDRVSHCFYNEYGVIVYSNNGGVYGEWDGKKFSLPEEGEYSSLTDGGIGYELRIRMIERAKTAREGVDIMAKLIEERGYNQLSRNFLVADADEAWIVEVVHGRRYVARRVPDDEVTVYPNCLIFNRLRPGDLASANIRAKGPDFDVIANYQGHRTWKSPYNIHRCQELYRLAAGVSVEAGAEYPFSVRPTHPVSTEDIKRGLRSHYEGLPFEVRDRHPAKNPKLVEPICRKGTVESLICELAKNPVETVFHMTVGRPCERPYGVYRPFAGELPADTAFGAKALERLANYRLPPPDRVKTAVFVGNGPRGNGCAEWLRLVLSSPEQEYTLVDADSIRAGALNAMDLLVVPGGSSPAIKKDLGEAGAEAIRAFVKSGGGYIGTCAGCCLAMDEKSDPERGIGLMPFHRIGNKGVALVPMAINEEGAAALGLKAETREIRYSHGPVLVPVESDDPDRKFSVWGTFAGDLESPKLKASMKDKVAMVGGTYGKGRVFAIACHPEVYQMTRDIVRGAFRYVTGREVSFPARTRKPGALVVGWFGSPVYGIVDAQTALQLEADECVDLFPMTKQDMQCNMLDHVDVLVLPEGTEESYRKYRNVIDEFLPGFIAREGKVFAWGHAASRLPKGGEAFSTPGELLKRVSDLARK